jgi:hypothetical protein
MGQLAQTGDSLSLLIHYFDLVFCLVFDFDYLHSACPEEHLFGDNRLLKALKSKSSQIRQIFDVCSFHTLFVKSPITVNLNFSSLEPHVRKNANFCVLNG